MVVGGIPARGGFAYARVGVEFVCEAVGDGHGFVTVGVGCVYEVVVVFEYHE
jgi:hypothetical protein